MTPIEHTKGPFILQPTTGGSSRFGSLCIYAPKGKEGTREIASIDLNGVGPHGANGALLTLAPTAPHTCTDEACPGAVNKRKLEAFDGLLEALRALANLDDDYEICTEKFHGQFDAARRAILKAEGRTT